MHFGQDKALDTSDLMEVAVATILAHATLSTASARELVEMMGHVLGSEAAKPELRAFLDELVHRRTLKRKAVRYNNEMSDLQRRYEEARLRGDILAAVALQRQQTRLFQNVLPVFMTLLAILDSNPLARD